MLNSPQKNAAFYMNRMALGPPQQSCGGYSLWSSNWRPYRGWLSGLAGLLGPSLFRFAQKLGLACGHPFTSVTPFGRRTAP
ncbi:hypothetical protein SGRA_0007 [Saprospira grandis str. Lewin]|uniref:Uncharacterized protein n=1 Tax=Saprospira grandis (strain Lewin) TaxID=984262 RepID=H6L3R7_SAPGL|nr:hypothetical protein SGRA_0007 [Saprospira grandis str. Lewin]